MTSGSIEKRRRSASSQAILASPMSARAATFLALTLSGISSHRSARIVCDAGESGPSGTSGAGGNARASVLTESAVVVLSGPETAAAVVCVSELGTVVVAVELSAPDEQAAATSPRHTINPIRFIPASQSPAHG